MVPSARLIRFDDRLSAFSLSANLDLKPSTRPMYSDCRSDTARDSGRGLAGSEGPAPERSNDSRAEPEVSLAASRGRGGASRVISAMRISSITMACSSECVRR